MCQVSSRGGLSVALGVAALVALALFRDVLPAAANTDNNTASIIRVVASVGPSTALIPTPSAPSTSLVASTLNASASAAALLSPPIPASNSATSRPSANISSSLQSVSRLSSASGAPTQLAATQAAPPLAAASHRAIGRTATCTPSGSWSGEPPAFPLIVANFGRFGNRAFQNLAISALVRKYDLAVQYSYAAECAALGLELPSGGRLMRGPRVAVTDDSIRALVEGATGDALAGNARVDNAPAGDALGLGDALPGDARVDNPLPVHYTVPLDAYFQTPWVARLVRDRVLPLMRTALERANPFRARLHNNSDTCVHVRLGDKPVAAADRNATAANFSRAIAWGAGSNAARREGAAGRVYVATEPASQRDPLVLALEQRHHAELVVLDVVQTVQFLATCKHVVVHDGTYSWLIAALATTMQAASVAHVTRELVWSGDIYVFDDWRSF